MDNICVSEAGKWFHREGSAGFRGVGGKVEGEQSPSETQLQSVFLLYIYIHLRTEMGAVGI